MKSFDLSLYLVTDSSGMEESVFLRKIEEALFSGITFLQLREKEKSTKEYFLLAEKVCALAKKYNVPFVIDDRIDIALAVDADGVHLGKEDLPVDKAREILGKDKIIGATAKTLHDAQIACASGADYLGVGAIYPTQTKVKTVITKVETVKEICSNVDIPVVAIGGLNKENIDVLQDSGVQGIAVVSAIMQSSDIKQTVKELNEKLKILGVKIT